MPREFRVAIAWSWMGGRELRVPELTPSRVGELQGAAAQNLS